MVADIWFSCGSSPSSEMAFLESCGRFKELWGTKRKRNRLVPERRSYPPSWLCMQKDSKGKKHLAVRTAHFTNWTKHINCSRPVDPTQNVIFVNRCTQKTASQFRSADFGFRRHNILLSRKQEVSLYCMNRHDSSRHCSIRTLYAPVDFDTYSPFILSFVS